MNLQKKLSLFAITSVMLISGCVIHVGAESSSGDQESVFGSIHVSDGKKAGDLETVNGSISIGENAIVGDVETVNGSIKVGAGSHIGSAETVNGGIKMSQQVKVGGDLETVNGSIRLQTGCNVGGDLETVNGDIQLVDTKVEGSLETVNGDISLTGKSTVKQNITFQRPSDGWFSSWFSDDEQSKVKLVVSSGSVIEGTVHLYRPVELEIAEGARIGKIIHHYKDNMK